MGKFFGFLLVLLLVLAGVAAGGWFYAQKLYTEAGPATADGTPRTVIIEPRSNVTAIAKKLVEGGAIRNDLSFRVAVRALDASTKLKAGEYAFDSGESLKSVIEQIIDGRVVLHSVTVPEGLTTAMIMRLLDAEPILSGALPSVTPAEGILLPDTYKVQRGEKRADLIARMIKDRKKLVDDLWANRQPGLPFETQEQAMILASIVEKETGAPDERPLVAAVLVNRMKRGMRLESDPTIIYGLTGGEPLGHGLRRSELDRQNAWNTYQIDGLPPTAICNPGRDAIRAVLNPPVSDALYFVANGSGVTAFSATYAEHMKNVAALRASEREAAKDEPAAPAPAPAPAKPPAKPAPKPADAATKPAPKPAPAN